MTEGLHLAVKVSPRRGNIQVNIHTTLSRTSPGWVASGTELPWWAHFLLTKLSSGTARVALPLSCCTHTVSQQTLVLFFSLSDTPGCCSCSWALKKGNGKGLCVWNCDPMSIALGKTLPVQYWGKVACWSALGQTKTDLGHRLSKHVFCKDRVVSEVAFLHHHILPSHRPQRLIPFHLCLALDVLSLHSSLPALPSLTHSLTIKLNNIGCFSPALFFPFFFKFSILPCHHYKLSCSVCSLIAGFPWPF